MLMLLNDHSCANEHYSVHIIITFTWKPWRVQIISRQIPENTHTQPDQRHHRVTPTRSQTAPANSLPKPFQGNRHTFSFPPVHICTENSLTRCFTHCEHIPGTTFWFLITQNICTRASSSRNVCVKVLAHSEKGWVKTNRIAPPFCIRVSFRNCIYS